MVTGDGTGAGTGRRDPAEGNAVDRGDAELGMGESTGEGVREGEACAKGAGGAAGGLVPAAAGGGAAADRDAATGGQGTGAREGGEGVGVGAREEGDERAVGERVARVLGLEPLPDEGGLFRRTHLDAFSSAIYFMVVAPEFSAMHVLGSTETYHWYAGAALRLLLLHQDGSVAEPVLGPDVIVGQRPQVVVPAGVWQGSSSAGAWSLVGTTVAPPFEWVGFRLGGRAELTARYPAAGVRIAELTRIKSGTG
ncbi:cupin domain-containing protein [Pseudonocardia sp. TRM90224]|uniref:cupin domain-containing protein n=1 Tax=Pseudonocardia sp. TRM90224 TaxID=2812678 RepID=UPI001E61744F|nr:cupin domain-containing protein [Pseudonocardia sp. TRM90224]